MALGCTAPQTGEAFLSGVLNYLDCQAQTIGLFGFQALASPASAVSLTLTILLTIFVAFFGIRMIFGNVPNVSDLMLAVFKVGIVLTLASSWVAYRTLAYDPVMFGPNELAETVGSTTGLSSGDNALIERLQSTDNGIVRFIDIGVGRFDLTAASQTQSGPMPRSPISDDFALGAARVLYLAGVLGAFGAVRLVSGILLALTPLFVGLLLFESTRPYFAGWVRMLVAMMLTATVISLVLQVELSLLEPWIAQVLALRADRLATPAAPLELLVITLSFAIILIGTASIGGRIAFSLHSPNWIQTAISVPRRQFRQMLDGLSASRSERTPPVPEAQSRAGAVADAVSYMQRANGAERNEQQTDTDQPRFGQVLPATEKRDGLREPVVPLGKRYLQSDSRSIRSISIRRMPS